MESHIALKERFPNMSSRNGRYGAVPAIPHHREVCDLDASGTTPSALAELTSSGFSVGKACTAALQGSGTEILMLGAPSTFSGDEVSMPAQYGYDRFQRDAVAHQLASATVDAALDTEQQDMTTTSADSSDSSESAGE